jgi:hypothetical protein
MSKKFVELEVRVQLAKEVLADTLAVSEKKWQDNEGHALIIGYLQGGLKCALSYLGVSQQEVDKIINSLKDSKA